MSLECAHCGTRCDDGSPRCPKCLRATHLVPVTPTASARPSRRGLLVGVVAVALVGAVVGITFSRYRPTSDAPRIPEQVAPAANDPLAIETPELRAVVERLRAERDPVARARMAASEVQQRRTVLVVSEDEPVPPPRGPDLLWRLLPSSRDGVTSLDLARLVAALLRGAGDTTAAVAERTTAPRPDEPLDPSGMLGSYVAVSGDHVVEVTLGTLVGSSTVRHRALSAASLAGAISAQAALELAEAGTAHDRALAYANAAVEAWGESPVPLAARARVWMLAGGSSGLSLAEADLRAATAMRDDAAFHMQLARLLLVRGDLVGCSRATTRAATMAPAWGTPAVALLALAPVLQQLDAGAPNACALLRNGRAIWTDDAYALCQTGVVANEKTSSARRILERAHDPLRLAFAAAALGADGSSALGARVSRAGRREAASWLMLFGRPELADGLMGAADAGAR